MARAWRVLSLAGSFGENGVASKDTSEEKKSSSSGSSSSSSSWPAESGERRSACGASFLTSAAAVPAACRTGCCADRTRTDKEGTRAGSEKDVKTCSQVDSDAGFELPGCLLRPSGQCSYETGSQLQRITRSARSRPSLHGWARKQQIRTHSSSGELGGRAGTVPPSSSMGLGLLLGRRVPLCDACCGGGSAATRRRRTMEERGERTFGQLACCGGVWRVWLVCWRRLVECPWRPCAWSVCRRRTGGAPRVGQGDVTPQESRTAHERSDSCKQPTTTPSTFSGREWT